MEELTKKKETKEPNMTKTKKESTELEADLILKKNEEENIPIIKEEKRGIYTILAFHFISWGLIATPYPALRIVGWLALGLIGFTNWKIMEKLFERGEKKQ